VGLPAMVVWTCDSAAAKLVVAEVAVCLTWAVCLASKSATSDATDDIVGMSCSVGNIGLEWLMIG
jgi:hypothetical protein